MINIWTINLKKNAAYYNGSGMKVALYSDSTPTPEPIIDHYEEREVERSRRVIDHIETYYTYEDDGNGHLIETPHERPVYKTEFYTVTEHVPVYKPQ